MAEELEGKTVVVTGAGRGLGAAFILPRPRHLAYLPIVIDSGAVDRKSA